MAGPTRGAGTTGGVAGRAGGLVLDDVDGGFLGRGGRAVDADVAGNQVLLGVGVGALVRAHQAAGPLVADLLVVAEVVAELLLVDPRSPGPGRRLAGALGAAGRRPRRRRRTPAPGRAPPRPAAGRGTRPRAPPRRCCRTSPAPTTSRAGSSPRPGCRRPRGRPGCPPAGAGRRPRWRTRRRRSPRSRSWRLRLHVRPAARPGQGMVIVPSVAQRETALCATSHRCPSGSAK